MLNIKLNPFFCISFLQASNLIFLLNLHVFMQNLNVLISFDRSKWSTDILILSKAERTKKIYCFYNKILFTLVLTENLNLSPHIFQTKYEDIFTFKINKDFFPLVDFFNDLFDSEKRNEITSNLKKLTSFSFKKTSYFPSKSLLKEIVRNVSHSRSWNQN